jgi:pimeloyl-ACP methyl ester carboxylesterase
MLSAAAVVVTLIAVLGGAATPPRAAAHPCTNTGTIRFRAADGTKLAGHRFGRGTTAIVFAHQSRGNACQWMPYARRLARQGYLTIAFDFRGYGDSQRRSGAAMLRLPADVTAAARLGRSLGATRVVLVGASMGGTAVVVAAANARPAVDGVVALSAPSGFGRMDGIAAARRLQMPILYVAGDKDDGFADESRALYDATTSTAKSLEILDSPYHGVELLQNDGVARSLVERFIRSS